MLKYLNQGITVIGDGVVPAGSMGDIILHNPYIITSESGYYVKIEPATGQYTRIGSATTSRTLNSNQDLLISGELEIDGPLFPDDDISMLDDKFVYVNTSDAGGIQLRNSSQTSPCIVMGSGASNIILLTSYTNREKDHDHSAQTNPTLFVHSATDPDSDNTQWISLSHDQTNGVINAGSGFIQINPAILAVDGITCQNELYITGNNLLAWSGYGAIRRSVDNGLMIATDPTDGSGNHNVIICSLDYNADNYGHNPASTDPTLFLHSATPAASATDQWISLSHDQTNGVIGVGTGAVEFISPVAITDDLFIGSTASNRVAITQRTGAGTEAFQVAVRDLLGRNILITDYDYRNRDHNHADSTNPTLFIHSGTDPLSDDTEWISLSHDQTNGVIATGKGGINLANNVVASGNISLIDDKYIAFGSSPNSYIKYSTLQTNDALLIGTHSDSHSILVTNQANQNKNHDHPAQTDPTLFVHSATDPDSDNTEWISLTHNRVNGVIESGKGAISFVNSLIVGNNQTLTFGESFLRHHTGQSANTVVWSMGTSARSLIFCESGDHVFDFSHAQQTNPTLFIHSANQATDEWISLAHDQTDPVIGAGKGTLKVPSYNRHHDILPGSATVGVTAPTATTIGTFRGLAFDADAEKVFFDVEVPSEWDGASDMTLHVVWAPESGAAISDTETVKWDCSYRSIAEGEALDNGTVATATATYTQSGAGTDKELIVTEITIDHDGANQPLAAGDTLGFQFDRDMSGDTYASDAIVLRWELHYTANRLGTH